MDIKDLKGNVIAAFTVRSARSNKGSFKKPGSTKMKRLQYNFKQISNQIMQSKTSANAKMVVTRARAKVVELLRKQTGGEYDNRELNAAIIHAKQMERIAKKRVRHLCEEENAGTEKGTFEDVEKKEDLFSEEILTEEDLEQNHEELQELLQQLQELMQELQDEMEKELRLDELSEELMCAASQNMDKDDLERLKRKHRCDELREIMEADMKYLKALFDKLEKDKQESSGISFEDSRSSFDEGCGISLELGGTEIPIDLMEAPVLTKGGAVDLSL